MRGRVYRRDKADFKACKRIDILYNEHMGNYSIDELCKMMKHGYLGRYIKRYKNDFKDTRRHYKNSKKFKNSSARAKMKIALLKLKKEEY